MCVKAALNTVVKHGRRVCVGDDATKFAKRWMPSNGTNRGIIRKTPDVANGLSLCVTVKYFVRRSQHKWQDNVNGEVWPSIAKRGAYGSRKSKRTFCIGCDSNPLRRQSALGFIGWKVLAKTELCVVAASWLVTRFFLFLHFQRNSFFLHQFITQQFLALSNVNSSVNCVTAPNKEEKKHQ